MPPVSEGLTKILLLKDHPELGDKGEMWSLSKCFIAELKPEDFRYPTGAEILRGTNQ